MVQTGPSLRVFLPCLSKAHFRLWSHYLLYLEKYELADDILNTIWPVIRVSISKTLSQNSMTTTSCFGPPTLLDHLGCELILHVMSDHISNKTRQKFSAPEARSFRDQKSMQKPLFVACRTVDLCTRTSLPIPLLLVLVLVEPDDSAFVLIISCLLDRFLCFSNSAY